MLDLSHDLNYGLACSFGPDSMALFYFLKKEGINFRVIHVNYGARKECKQETLSLIKYCSQNNIEIDVKYCKSSLKKANFEAEARKIRYQYFEEMSKVHQLDAILVAHQEDDVLETYFLQRKRGGFVEHFGLKSDVFIFGVRIIRPLLRYKKSELLKICNETNTPYAIDSSNYCLDFQRNVIRHTILSKMSQKDKDFTLKEISKLNEEIANTYQKLSCLDLHNKNVLIKLETNEFQRAIVILLREVVKDHSISAPFAKEIKKVIVSAKPNITYNFFKNINFVKEYDWVGFSVLNDDISYSFKIDKPMVFETSYFFLDFTKDTRNRNIFISDYPLVIRNAVGDDVVKIANYESKVRRLFIDWKVPTSLRKKWPVILNKDNKIIYIPRYRKDYKPKRNDNFFVKVKS